MLRTGQLHRAPPRPRDLARRRGPRYRGPWRLPGPDSHRLAAVSLSLGYVVVLLLSVVLGARATGRTFRRNMAPNPSSARDWHDASEGQRVQATRPVMAQGPPPAAPSPPPRQCCTPKCIAVLGRSDLRPEATRLDQSA